jgi:hypothetical protein
MRGITAVGVQLTLTQGVATGSIIASLTSATYAALQAGSSSSSDDGGSSNSSIAALLAQVRQFPDMLADDERRMRLERVSVVISTGGRWSSSLLHSAAAADSCSILADLLRWTSRDTVHAKDAQGRRPYDVAISCGLFEHASMLHCFAQGLAPHLLASAATATGCSSRDTFLINQIDGCVRWLQSDVQAHATAKVSSLVSIMRGVSSGSAQLRCDASRMISRSSERCLLPVFELLGLSASSCTLAPVPLQIPMSLPSSSQLQLPPPQMIISSSNTPGITIVAPHKGSAHSRVSLSATDNDGYYVTDGQLSLRDDGGVSVAAQTEASTTFIPLVADISTASRAVGQTGGGGDITALAVFAIGDAPVLPHDAAQGSKKELSSAIFASACGNTAAAEVSKASSEHFPLLLVYASSSFADERVCLRAKLLQLHGGDSDGWSISKEADLLHPPSKDTPHFDVTCIIGCKGLVFASDVCGYITCWVLQPQLTKTDVQWRSWAHPGGMSSMVIFTIRKNSFIVSGGHFDTRLILWSLDGQLLCTSCLSGKGAISIVAAADMIAVETSAGIDVFVALFYLEAAVDPSADDSDDMNLLQRKRTLPCCGPMCFAESLPGSRHHSLLYACSSSHNGSIEV